MTLGYDVDTPWKLLPRTDRDWILFTDEQPTVPVYAGFTHEATATQRAYRKEAERLILWAIVERSKALSSLTTEDAIAYRAFLRNPAPRVRWIGSPRPRNSPEWRPFAGALSTRSTAYALSVLGALFRWLIEQRYSSPTRSPA